MASPYALRLCSSLPSSSSPLWSEAARRLGLIRSVSDLAPARALFQQSPGPIEYGLPDRSDEDHRLTLELIADADLKDHVIPILLRN